MNIPIDKLIELRREIHKNPELSNEERETSRRIVSFIKQFSPDEIITNIGGYGVAAIYNGEVEGKTIVIRSELDALPINEINDFDYRSSEENVAHKCGHDGHMTIVAGLASILHQKKLSKGRVILLFQPAEETGEGAERILKDERFLNLKPDYFFGLHNLPGFPAGKIILKDEHFAAASKGMIIKLNGKTSHAAEPENGISPSNAIAEIIKFLNRFISNTSELKDFSLITVIYARLGESAAFGTTPGYGEVMATLRSARNDDMDLLTKKIVHQVEEIADKEGLELQIGWTEEFPATVNDKDCVVLIKNAAEKNKYDFEFVREPFKWSEDYGHYLNQYKGAFFGLGAGEKHSQLHNPDYDFPEKIIETGVNIFYSLIESLAEGN